jgi:hypothetical protein
LTQIARYFLKTCRETALVLFGAAVIIAVILSVTLYLMRNSNSSTAIGDYEFYLSGGQLFMLHISDSNRKMKLDKPDLLLLAVTTSLCVLAWAVFMRWRSLWRRGPQGVFPIQLSRLLTEIKAK